MTKAAAQSELLARVEGRVGRLTLNRPGALHALTTAMCRQMTAALLQWQDDPAVELVLMDHAGERGFCAGGDIRMLAESGAVDGRAAREFFAVEYRLNELLHRYPKPAVALMDGVVMGGGAGVSQPARFRIATERTVFAMPETGIGLFPDVGGGWRLARTSDQIGTWLALTGARLKAADCMLIGVATHHVESAGLSELKAAILADPAGTPRLLQAFESDPGRPPLADRKDEIREAFGHRSVEAVVTALEAAGTDWSREQLSVLKTKSPMSLKVTLRQLQEGAAAATFAENMAMEYRLASRLVRSHDFLEGVRALIVDKDNAPQWAPSKLGDIADEFVDEFFAPLPPHQEWSPLFAPSRGASRVETAT